MSEEVVQVRNNATSKNEENAATVTSAAEFGVESWAADSSAAGKTVRSKRREGRAGEPHVRGRNSRVQEEERRVKNWGEASESDMRGEKVKKTRRKKVRPNSDRSVPVTGSLEV